MVGVILDSISIGDDRVLLPTDQCVFKRRGYRLIRVILVIAASRMELAGYDDLSRSDEEGGKTYRDFGLDGGSEWMGGFTSPNTIWFFRWV